MKVMKSALILIAFALLAAAPKAGAVEVTPGNFTSDGGLFSFDLIVTGDAGVDIAAEQILLTGVSGPSTLTFDAAASEAVKNDAPYWLAGNAPDPFAFDGGDGSYSFSDSPGSTAFETVALNDILARFAFAWDGTEGDYSFTFDLDTSATFLLEPDFTTSHSMSFPTGDWIQTPIVDTMTNGFVVHLPVPEPATISLFALASLALLRRRR
jgi:hypothetical protein